MFVIKSKMSNINLNTTIDFSEINHLNLTNLIKTNGYAIVTNVITTDKSDSYIAKIWSWLESLNGGINRNDSSTWITHEKAKKENLKSYNWPKNSHGIISNYGISHSNFVWEARCEKNIKTVFSQIWNTNELLVSYDGVCVMLPQNITQVENTSYWFHFDQSPNKEGFQCVQGFLNLQDTTENDGCLMVYPKSNNYHKIFFEEKGLKFDYDWYAFNEINKGNEWMINKGLNPIKVIAPKGSLILWDSRTVHCSSPPKSNNIRYAIYICMMPKFTALKEDIELKKHLFKNRIGTSHWPNKPEPIFDETTIINNNENDIYCDICFPHDDLQINNDILRLIGYDVDKFCDIINFLEEVKENYENNINVFIDKKIFTEEHKKFKIFYNNIKPLLYSFCLNDYKIECIKNINIDEFKLRYIKNELLKFQNTLNALISINN